MENNNLFSFKQYLNNVQKLKDRGTIDADIQKNSPRSAGSRGLRKTHDFIKSKVQMMGEAKEYILENLDYCVHCHNLILSEKYQGGLRKWFKQKWVNIGKKKKGGGHPECGTSGSKKGYAKCVPASKARSMSKKQKKSAVSRKRAAQNKAGRGGKDTGGTGKAPIRVSTKPKK